MSLGALDTLCTLLDTLVPCHARATRIVARRRTRPGRFWRPTARVTGTPFFRVPQPVCITALGGSLPVSPRPIARSVTTATSAARAPVASLKRVLVVRVPIAVRMDPVGRKSAVLPESAAPETARCVRSTRIVAAAHTVLWESAPLVLTSADEGEAGGSWLRLSLALGDSHPRHGDRSRRSRSFKLRGWFGRCSSGPRESSTCGRGGASMR
jgi:hypothetical protein